MSDAGSPKVGGVKGKDPKAKSNPKSKVNPPPKALSKPPRPPAIFKPTAMLGRDPNPPKVPGQVYKKGRKFFDANDVEISREEYDLQAGVAELGVVRDSNTEESEDSESGPGRRRLPQTVDDLQGQTHIDGMELSSEEDAPRVKDADTKRPADAGVTRDNKGNYYRLDGSGITKEEYDEAIDRYMRTGRQISPGVPV